MLQKKRGMQLEKEQIQLFEEQRIRTAWDEKSEEWYFSIVDVVGVLTECKDYNAARNYWKERGINSFDDEEDACECLLNELKRYVRIVR